MELKEANWKQLKGTTQYLMAAFWGAILGENVKSNSPWFSILRPLSIRRHNNMTFTDSFIILSSRAKMV